MFSVYKISYYKNYVSTRVYSGELVRTEKIFSSPCRLGTRIRPQEEVAVG